MVELERRRIARELHDTVGHGLLVIAMHARRLAATAPAALGGANAIDHVAQRTLRDVRDVVGVLRGIRPPTANAADAPPLSTQAAQIVAALPESLDVDLRVIGVERELPEAIATTALRVLQEGLSNSIKYGGGRAIQVLAEFSAGTVMICVETKGGPARCVAGSLCPGGSGSGLAGLRERVHEQGGVLESGARPLGGYLLTARIPIDGDAADMAVAVNGGHRWTRSGY